MKITHRGAPPFQFDGAFIALQATYDFNIGVGSNPVTLDGLYWDTSNYYQPDDFPNSLVIPRDGFYFVLGHLYVQTTGNGGHEAQTRLRISGSTYDETFSDVYIAVGTPNVAHTTKLAYQGQLFAGDDVSMSAASTGPGATARVIAGIATSLSIAYIGM